MPYYFPLAITKYQVVYPFANLNPFKYEEEIQPIVSEWMIDEWQI